MGFAVARQAMMVLSLHPLGFWAAFAGPPPECDSTALKTPFLTAFQRALNAEMAVSEWWRAEIALLAERDQRLQKTKVCRGWRLFDRQPVGSI